MVLPPLIALHPYHSSGRSIGDRSRESTHSHAPDLPPVSLALHLPVPHGAESGIGTVSSASAGSAATRLSAAINNPKSANRASVCVAVICISLYAVLADRGVSIYRSKHAVIVLYPLDLTPSLPEFRAGVNRSCQDSGMKKERSGGPLLGYTN